jgi:hypothetical protein
VFDKRYFFLTFRDVVFFLMSMDSGTDFKIALCIPISFYICKLKIFIFLPQKKFWKSVLNSLQMREEYYRLRLSENGVGGNFIFC